MKIIYWVALVISLCALVVSLIVHIRSAEGFDLYHWILPFGFIAGLFFPYLLACDDIVHGGVKLWRKRPLQSTADNPDGRPSLFLNWEQQQRWGQEVFRTRPAWIKKVDLLFIGYFFVVFGLKIIKNDPSDTHILPWASPLPAPDAFFFSAGSMAFYEAFAGTFWHVLQLDRKGHTSHQG